MPTYNEESVLVKTLCQIALEREAHEIIIVDGGSLDQTIHRAHIYGKVYTSSKGRSKQMNEGARFARGDILLFLHADTIFEDGSLTQIRHAVQDGFIGGCFCQKIDETSFIFRCIESSGNIRARLRNVFYGDQGIFVRKDIFDQLHGYRDIELFEDVDFSIRLRKMGPLKVLSKRLWVSGRRWRRYGIVKATLINRFLLLLFRIRIPVRYLIRMYPDVR
ncbi:MAG: TIGR04283 family arsenosugar biosynthesis glycosyltransferase [Chlamydiota bacterium]|nr:TIGR04283 family arsenosugar biosynthesis glycosyltransferase [Chlamydiota bacterium]